jgi:uncharacterized protein (TIGR00369 family)
MMDLRERLQTALQSIFPSVLEIELVETSAERVVGHLVVRRPLCNLAGVLHGGALMSFADTLGGLACFLNLPRDARTTTIESKTNFVRAAKEGTRLVGESTPLHLGRTTMVWQTRIFTESGALCAIVTQTQLVVAAGHGSSVGAPMPGGTAGDRGS